MAVKVAINGFGRIGRLVLKRILETDSSLEVVAINDLTDNEDLIYLLKYDTAQGRFPYEVSLDGDKMQVGDYSIQTFEEKDAANLPWGDLGIDIVLECTGFYTSKEKSEAHIQAGAKRVLISAPAKDEVTKTIVFGVNEDSIAADDQIVSAASCTTNALAPLVFSLNNHFGVKRALMSTIHGYTASQRLQDSPGGRKNRAAAQNAIPYTTGAAKAIGKVIPELNGKIDGSAIRIPVVTGSMVELYTVLDRDVTIDEVNAAMKADASDSYVYVEDEIVSSDVIGFPAGSLFDSTQTKLMDADGGQLVKTVTWYDNEYGFVSNMVRTLEHFANLAAE